MIIQWNKVLLDVGVLTERQNWLIIIKAVVWNIYRKGYDMRRFLFSILVMVEVLSMKVYASEIKIRDEFISDISVENSGDEFVLSHSDADFSYDLYQLYRKDRLIVSGLKPSEIFEGITVFCKPFL